MSKGVFKNVTFILLLISLVVMSVVLVDITVLEKDNQYINTYCIIWVCNLIACILHILKFNPTTLPTKQ